MNLKHLKIFLIFSISVFCLKVSAQDGYKIKFRIDGVKDTMIHIGYHYGEKQYLKDSSRADAKGYVEFSGKEKLPSGIYLLVFPSKSYIEFVVDDKQHFTIETDLQDAPAFKRLKVKGSPENDLFYEYTRNAFSFGSKADSLKRRLDAASDTTEAALIRKQLKENEEDVNKFKKNIIQKHSNTFVASLLKAMEDPIVPDPPVGENGQIDSTFAYRYFKDHYFDNVDFSDDRLLRSPVFHSKLKMFFSKVVMQLPDSLIKEADIVIKKARAHKEVFKYCVWYLTNTYETSNIMGMDAVFVSLVEKYYMTNEAFWVDETVLYKITDRANTLKPLLIGKIAPNLTMKDMNGKLRSLHGVQAKYTILCFWDPDCGHCKKTVPKLDTLFEKVQSKGIEIYAVCTETEVDKWKKFVEEHHLDWIHVADLTHQTNFRKTYDISSTPVIYLLNDKKEIIAKKLSVEQLDEFLQRLLKE